MQGDGGRFQATVSSSEDKEVTAVYWRTGTPGARQNMYKPLQPGGADFSWFADLNEDEHLVPGRYCWFVEVVFDDDSGSNLKTASSMNQCFDVIGK